MVRKQRMTEGLLSSCRDQKVVTHSVLKGFGLHILAPSRARHLCRVAGGSTFAERQKIKEDDREASAYTAGRANLPCCCALGALKSRDPHGSTEGIGDPPGRARCSVVSGDQLGGWPQGALGLDCGDPRTFPRDQPPPEHFLGAGSEEGAKAKEAAAGPRGPKDLVCRIQWAA